MEEQVTPRRFLDPQPKGRPADRVQGLIGSLESGIPDLAENRRTRVRASLRRARCTRIVP